MREVLRPSFCIGVVVLAVLSGCAQSAGEPEDDSPRPSRLPIHLPSIEALPSDGDPVTGEVPEHILAAIVSDASDRIGVGEDEITVTRGEAVTWNDGALGCPEPGMFYTQALVDGYHVVLGAAGETLDYRVDSAGGFRLCMNPARPSG